METLNLNPNTLQDLQRALASPRQATLAWRIATWATSWSCRCGMVLRS